MELLGWTCRFALKKKSKKKARDRPYTVGGDKDWWATVRDDSAKLCRYYSLALWKAEQHKREVPHLRGVNTYKMILDPEWKPKKKNP